MIFFYYYELESFPYINSLIFLSTQGELTEQQKSSFLSVVMLRTETEKMDVKTLVKTTLTIQSMRLVIVSTILSILLFNECNSLMADVMGLVSLHHCEDTVTVRSLYSEGLDWARHLFIRHSCAAGGELFSICGTW